LFGDGLLLDKGELIVVTFDQTTLTFVKLDDGVTWGGEAATKPVNKGSRIRSAEIRRIRVHQRAIVRPDGPLINADSAGLRGSGRGMGK